MHGNRRIFVAFVVIALVGARAGGPGSPRLAGLWRTEDDKTHKPRGLVRIYDNHGAFYGRIVACFDPKEAKAVCAKCPGEQRGKPIIGLVILTDMRPHGNEYSGGQILDPETGEAYRCIMTLENGGAKLLVRGYVGFSVFGRSQVWTRDTSAAGDARN